MENWRWLCYTVIYHIIPFELGGGRFLRRERKEKHMANRVTIQIAGQRYTMLADETEEYMNEVALLAQQTIAACGGSDAFASTRALALSTVNLADELMKAKRQISELQARLDAGQAQAEPPASADEEQPEQVEPPASLALGAEPLPAQGKTEQVLNLLKTGPRAEPPAEEADKPAAQEDDQNEFEQVQLGDAPPQAPKPAVNAAQVIHAKKKHGGKPSHPAYRR